ncbi:alpha/beta hydrolase [Saccharothrix deserti]|uniref:alpha/beta hydrolase n=1 Tax=Saccharothrix deserti TaxID=2593674 RepID=UPI001EE4D02C|nr:alpha/beta hydrolase [Saccharothrix deserti]
MAVARRALVAVTIVVTGLVAPGGATAQTETATRHAGDLPNGTTWIADVPARWNGTILLYSHGYNPFPANPPQNAPNQATADALLARGYALAGSSYSRSGWATGTAAQDQLDTLRAVTALTGAPRHAIAVGTSMGGLVTGVLAERAGARLDGALATCGLMGGGTDLLNYQLDGAHALARLLLGDQSPKLVRFGSAAEATATAQRMVDALDQAQATPDGRARTALITSLFLEPAWESGQPKPAPGDRQAQQVGQYRNLRAVLPFIVPARYDIEQTSGGNPSWNAGVDYRRLLVESGGLGFVADLYRQAGADLNSDLDLLTRTADVTADDVASRWMTSTSVLNGRLPMPVLTMHTTDDNLVPVQHEEEYAEDVRMAGSGGLLRQSYADHPGHCTFTTAELVAAVETVHRRVETGRWDSSTQPRRMQALAESLGLGPAAFVEFRPQEFTGDRRSPR